MCLYVLAHLIPVLLAFVVLAFSFFNTKPRDWLDMYGLWILAGTNVSHMTH